MGLKILRHVRDFSPIAAGTVGLVPTMGALHAGHSELIRVAASECETCVVSLFVNPTQFGPQEDFARYPRSEPSDFRLCEEAGADVVFCPSTEEMYPRKTTWIRVEGVSERWEGAHRPGHFDGVATVVAKLFHIVQPDRAYFGWKDFQQCAVLKRMVEDLNFRLDLRFLATVREPDGLAMSSRNTYLEAGDRAIAPLLFATLQEASARIRKDQLNASAIQQILQESRDRLASSGFDVDYLAMVDPADLSPIAQVCEGARLIVAARLGLTRLIDNCPV